MKFTDETNVSMPGAAAEGLLTAACAVNRKLHMEEMYEVLKFIEHGTQCRRSLDCVQGVSLIRWMRGHPEMDRRGILVWFRDIATCIDQYHRSGNGQDYRYLNPYSLIVTEENRLMLLDLEAPDNVSVIKQMQTGAVRDHFLRPLHGLGITRNHEADLFAYGKTIQFILAYMEVHPALTKMEEMKLSRLIRRCTGEAGRRYADFAQVMKALPQVPETVSHKSKGSRLNLKRIAGGVGLGAVSCLCLCVLLGLEKESLVRAEEEAICKAAENEGKRKAEEEYERKLMQLQEEQENGQTIRSVSEQMAAAAEMAADAAEGRRMQEIVKQLIAAYDGLLKYEKDPVKTEEIRKKKEDLEKTL